MKPLYPQLMKPLYPQLECRDGFKMSVQASKYHYCMPRVDEAQYSHVEIGFPSEPEPLLLPYMEQMGDEPAPCESVYPYVPANVVLDVIEKHGGPVDPGKTKLPVFVVAAKVV